jgi:hypothetical protein
VTANGIAVVGSAKLNGNKEVDSSLSLRGKST